MVTPRTNFNRYCALGDVCFGSEATDFARRLDVGLVPIATKTTDYFFVYDRFAVLGLSMGIEPLIIAVYFAQIAAAIVLVVINAFRQRWFASAGVIIGICVGLA